MAATFSDFDAYAQAIWDADLSVRLLHPYERCWSIEQRELDPLRVQYGVEGSGLLARGAVRADGWGFYMQQSGAPVSINGHGRVEWYFVYLPGIALDLDHDIPRQLRSAEVLTVESKLHSRIRSALDVILTSELDEYCATSPESVVMQANLLSAFRQLFSQSCESGCPAERQIDVERRALISQVSELIHDAGGWELPVPRLCSAVGVSQRTLLTAFREQLGTTPQNYLIAHRLHLARRSLMKSGPFDTTVGAVAAKFGFFDPGRFAGRYLMLFGERPSESLRRRV